MYDMICAVPDVPGTMEEAALRQHRTARNETIKEIAPKGSIKVKTPLHA